MIELIATVESLSQAEALLSYVDTLYFGEEQFGLRLPHSFSREQQAELVALAHQKGKKVTVAVNGIMHPEKMTEIPAYLAFLRTIKVDQIAIGDPGIIYVMKHQPELAIPFIYDGETLVTSARQINFWAKKGAVGAVLAREVPFEEMHSLVESVTIPTEVLVYGATCIHQSKRPLLQNYYHFTKQKEQASKERGLFLSEPKKPDTHYSIFEDSHGTHIFANNDLCLTDELAELVATGYGTWKLDGLFTPGDSFVEVTSLYHQARQAILAGKWDEHQGQALFAKLAAIHPQSRKLDTGFYHLDPTKIK